MRSKIESRKSKTKLPGIAIVVIIVIFIGLGAKAIVPMLNRTAGKQQSTAAKENEREKSSVISSSYGGIRPSAQFSNYQVAIEQDLLKPLGWEKTVAKPPPSRPAVQRKRPQRRPEPTNDLVLTGIVNLGEEPIALVEDTSNGKAYFLKKGDKLKDYLVEAITEENIVLANGDSKLTPALGSKAYYDSSGKISMSGVTGEQVGRDSTGGADGETDSSDVASDNLSLIERLKARRRKELGQE